MKKSTVILLLLIIPIFTVSGQNSNVNKGQQVMLETIGHLSAQSLYLSYLVSNTIADGHSQNLYDNAMAIELLNKVIAFAQQTPQQMDKLLASGKLGDEDIIYVNNLIEAFQLITAQAGAYRNFITSGNKTHLQTFSNKRKEAWQKISILLNIE